MKTKSESFSILVVYIHTYIHMQVHARTRTRTCLIEIEHYGVSTRTIYSFIRLQRFPGRFSFNSESLGMRRRTKGCRMILAFSLRIDILHEIGFRARFISVVFSATLIIQR